MPKITDVHLMYTCIKTPVTCYDESKGKEYKVDVVVSEDAAEDWDEEFPKQKAKRIKNEKFLETYKVESVPFDDQKYQYVIKIKKPANLADGSPLPDRYRPRAYLQIADGEMEDITEETMIGNGSEGTVVYETMTNDFGTFAKLKGVLVTNLIPYDGGEEVSVEDELGMTVRSAKGDAKASMKAELEGDSEKKPARKRRTAKAPAADDPDDDIPF